MTYLCSIDILEAMQVECPRKVESLVVRLVSASAFIAAIAFRNSMSQTACSCDTRVLDMYDDESEDPQHAPAHRRRRSSSPPPGTSAKKQRYSNGRAVSGSGAAPLQPLSLSIVGVEPLDEFIREIADWIHGLITSRDAGGGVFEVEAKLGHWINAHRGCLVEIPFRVAMT